MIVLRKKDAEILRYVLKNTLDRALLLAKSTKNPPFTEQELKEFCSRVNYEHDRP